MKSRMISKLELTNVCYLVKNWGITLNFCVLEWATTVCPGSSYPNLYNELLYKLG